MKILFLNQTFYPDSVATAQQLIDLSEYLIQQGHQVSVITSKRGYDNPTALHSGFERFHGVEIHRVGSTGFGKSRVRWRLVDALTFLFAVALKLIRFPKQDLVISLTSPPLIGFLGVLFTLVKGGQSTQWLMDINPDMAIEVGYLSRQSWITKSLNWIFEFTLRNSSKMVVLDRFMKERVIRHGGNPADIVIVPPWSSHPDEIQERPKSLNIFRRQHDLQNKFVILYSGNHSIVHPLDTLLEAARSSRDQKDLLFLFIGSGARVSDVTEFKNANELQNIMQLPHQPREVLPDSLSAADVHVVVMGDNTSGLVHPSKVYGILSAGKPFVFIGPKRSHVTELLNECPVGYQVEHGNVAGFLNAIQKISHLSVDEQQAIASHCKNFLKKNYAKAISFNTFSEAILKTCPSTFHTSTADLERGVESRRAPF